jgi:predicted permease
MRALREFLNRLRSSLSRDVTDREMDEEMATHLRLAEEALVRTGMRPEEARRAARVKFGGVERFREASRDEQRIRVLEDLWADMRYAMRVLAKTPAFTLVALGSLALGIGANTAIFSAVDGVLLRPFTYAAPDELVALYVHDEGRDPSSHSVVDYTAITGNARGFASIGAVYPAWGGLTVVGDEGAEQVVGSWVTSGTFATLAVPPQLGRTFSEADDATGAPFTVILSDGFWRSRYAADPSVIGRTIRVQGQPRVVIGVMPPRFRMPGHSEEAIWLPAQLETPTARAPFFMRMYARLKPGVSLSQVQSELRTIAVDVARQYPSAAAASWTYEALPLKEAVVGDLATTMWVLYGTVVLVLLIALANVASLTVVKATTRLPELGLRTALGAGRGRLVRQLLAESMLLCVVGGGLGLLLAYGGVKVLGSLAPADLPQLDLVAVNGRVLLWTLLVTILAAIVVGLTPALAVPHSLRGWLQEGGRGGGAKREGMSVRGAFVAFQFAMALTIAVGAGLLVNSLLRLQAVQPGTITEGLLTARLSPPQPDYPGPERVLAFYETLLAELENAPTVRAVAVSMALPPNRLVMTNPVTPEGMVIDAATSVQAVEELLISPGYFEALGIPVRQGRAFSDTDRDGAPQVAIVNESFVRRYFQDGRALGRWIQFGNPDPESPRVEIVGVVGNVKYQGLESEFEPTVYVPYAQNAWWNSMYLVVRTAGDPTGVVPLIRSKVAELDPNIPLQDVRTIDELLSESVGTPRFRTALVLGFAVVAILLAMTGAYGVMAYSITQRLREMGIRMALGARPADVRRLVLTGGLKLAGPGLVIGLVAAIVLGRVLEDLLYGVGARDPATLAIATGALVVAACVASLVPALRAARAQPAETLRVQ